MKNNMKIVRKKAYNTNTTLFHFEGYLSKLAFIKDENGNPKEIIAAYATNGTCKIGGIRFVLSKFEGKKEDLKEGQAYTFYVNVTTGENTELYYKHLINVKPLDGEPIKDTKTTVVGQVIDLFPTEAPDLHVIKIECESENPIGKEYYTCRVKVPHRSIAECWQKRKWVINMQIKQSPLILSWYDERQEAYAVETETRKIWVDEKDSNGNTVVITDEFGNEKIRKIPKYIDTFIETIWATPITQFIEE